MALKGLNHWLLYTICVAVILCVVVVYNMKRYNTVRDTNPFYQQMEVTDVHSTLSKFMCNAYHYIYYVVS